MAHTSEQYRDAALAMLPRGPAWNHAPKSVMWQFWYAIGVIFAILESDLAKLDTETRARETNELLPEWEQDYGLPSIYNADTFDARKQALIAKTAKKQVPTPAYLKQFSADMGYTIDVIQHKPFCCGDPTSQCGDGVSEIGLTRSMLGIKVTNVTGNIPLSYFVQEINRIVPAHVYVGVDN